MQALAVSLLLPPLLLVVLCLAVCLVAALARGAYARVFAVLGAVSAALVLLLATPYASAQLRLSLQKAIPAAAAGRPPGAIVVLAAESVPTVTGTEIGALTLERVRTAASLARRTGLPLLVTGGLAARGAPSLAELMARSLRHDFGLEVRWREARAADTRQNALYAAAILRENGIDTVFVVTHAWHLPRSMDAFVRAGITPLPAPVRLDRPLAGQWTDFVPRPDHLGTSWLMLREWIGRKVYTLRDGPARQ